MSHKHADLADYYEKEAQLRKRGRPREPRVRLQDEYIELLRAEGRSTVVDFGAGPGQDGDRFRAAGFGYLGLDLAHGNGLLAAERDLVTIQGSITVASTSPPILQVCEIETSSLMAACSLILSTAAITIRMERPEVTWKDTAKGREKI